MQLGGAQHDNTELGEAVKITVEGSVSQEAADGDGLYDNAVHDQLPLCSGTEWLVLNCVGLNRDGYLWIMYRSAVLTGRIPAAVQSRRSGFELGWSSRVGRRRYFRVEAGRCRTVRSFGIRAQLSQFYNGTSARDDYDAICVLGGGYHDDGTLPVSVKRRVALAHKLHQQQSPSCKILCVGSHPASLAMG